MESNNVLRDPGAHPRGCSVDGSADGHARADAHTAVNEVFARKAASRWRLARQPTVVAELPRAVGPRAGRAPGRSHPRSHRAAADHPDLPLLGSPRAVRRAGPGRRGGPAGARHGARGPRVRARLGPQRRPRRRSRSTPVATSPCRSSIPTSSPSWVASADVALCTLPPLSYNQRFTTPEQVPRGDGRRHADRARARDFPRWRRCSIARTSAASPPRWSPADIAAAIREILDLPAAERAAWRERIAATARARYSWPLAAAAYLDLRVVAGADRSTLRRPR